MTRSPYPMIPVSDAIDSILNATAPLPPVRIPFLQAGGMVLAEDIRMKSGAMVMPRETTLSNYGIERLRGYYHELAGISNKVSVYKSDVRG